MEDAVSIRKDSQVQTVEQEIPNITSKAVALKIDSELKSKHANDLLVACKKMFNIAEDRRKFFVKPLQDHVKTINDEFKKLTTPLKEVEGVLKEKLLSYVRVMQETSRKAQEAKQDITKGFLDTPTAIIEKPKVTIDSGLGKSYTKKVWRWEIVNFDEIEREYLILDEKKINGLVRAHTKNVHGVISNDLVIKGIKVFQEDELAVRI